MVFSDKHNYSEDMFADTRMSFGEHLEELRVHLWRAIIGFLIALCFSFFIGRPVLKFIALPVEEQLTKFYDERVGKMEEDLNRGDQKLQTLNSPIKNVPMSFPARALAEQLLPEREADAIPSDRQIEINVTINEPLRLVMKLHHGLQAIGRRPALSTLSVQEAFMAYFKVCLACGFVIGSPWIFYQIWLFVAAGLYPNEKRLVHVYLPFSLGLFLAGVLVCEFLVLPKAIEALLWFNQWIGLEPDLRFNEWLGFAIMMPLVFGVSFQLPLVMMFLERIGIVTVQAYKDKWRISLMLIEVFAAVITPSVDVVSMQLLALPMFALYVLGIYLCRLNPAREFDIDVPDSEEMVEV